MLKNIPEAMLRICPGYRTYEPVAPSKRPKVKIDKTSQQQDRKGK
jgi:hypothetical protein